MLGPVLAHLVAAAPRAVLGSLSNAAITIGNHPGARLGEWLAGMAHLTPFADDWDKVRRLGQVLAWRAGLAHFQQGALEAADALPRSLSLRAVGAQDDEWWPDVRAALQRNPWYAPGANRESVSWRAGAFIGFGGPFPLPPRVRALADGFLVESGDRQFHLFADAFGFALLPAARGEAGHAPSPFTAAAPTLEGRTLKSEGRTIALDLPDEGTSVAWNDHTLAVSSAFSYAIRVFPRRGSEP